MIKQENRIKKLGYKFPSGESNPSWNPNGKYKRGNYPCPKCGKNRIIKQGGANRQCLECYRKDLTKTFDRKKWHKVFKTKMKEFAVQYLGGKCQKCNNVYPNPCFHFHHINKNEKNYHVGRLYRVSDYEKLTKELDKCELLCANCHAIVTWVEDAENK